jgi:hypothetical protein
MDAPDVDVDWVRVGFSLQSIAEQETAAQEKNTRATIRNRIVSLLKERGGEMVMGDCLDAIPCNRSLKFEIRDELVSSRVLALEGVPYSKTNPLRLRLLTPEWTAGIVIANPSSVVVSRDESVTLRKPERQPMKLGSTSV